MKIYPAIDLKEGRCVRLIRGEAKSGREYGDPIEWAKRWEAEGAQYLHVDRKSTRLNSSHRSLSRMPSSA